LQAAFVKFLRVAGGYLKAGTSFLKRVTGKLSVPMHIQKVIF
jgi:hypothetical protein